MFSILAQAPQRWDYSIPQFQWDSSTWLSGTGRGDYCRKKEMSTPQTSTATRLSEHRSAVQLFQMPRAGYQPPVKPQCRSVVRDGYATSSCVPQLSREMWDCGQEENSSVFQ